MRNLKKIALLLFLPLQLWAGDFTYPSLPVQDNGRVKPLITFARESLQLIHGKSHFEGKPALDIVTTWILVPQIWEDKEIIKIDHHGLKEALNLEKREKYFSPKHIRNQINLNVLFGDLNTRLKRKEKLDPYYQAIQRLQAQLLTFYGIARGGFAIFPPPSRAGEQEKTKSENEETSTPPRGDGRENPVWLRLEELEAKKAELFFKIMSAHTTQFTDQGILSKEEGKKRLKTAINEFTEQAKKANDQYPEAEDMTTEVHYQKLDPFFWTWIAYLLAGIFYALSLMDPKRKGAFAVTMRSLGSTGLIIGFLFHSWGFILRCLIAGRPPVSNMYETVVWVGWGVVLFSGLFYLFKKKFFVLFSGTLVATLCMMTADFSPVILDDRLTPLEPVLRSNLWLTVHVMTITLSYAAFFLALGVADYSLLLKIMGKGSSKKMGELAKLTYHIIQVGVVLLTAGTILGGIWADYSWGRFWGWDPKETWAFIALMGYIALLHARLVGWAKDFGMLAGAVIAFNLIIMAWYGVNFILGAGLHSYGFGAGGMKWVLGFSTLQLITLAYAWFMDRINLKQSPKP